jgi:uncharacterized membrane protein (DUF485 family)
MAQNVPTTDDAIERRKSAIGIQMTILYSVIYAGFVILSVFQPTWMGVRAVLGLNLAVTYGIGLILIAILFALVYNYLCRVPPTGAEPRASSASGPQAGQQES